jgi:hypothetical protein
MSPIGITTVVVLGSLYLFFMHAIVKAQLIMRRPERVRQPRFTSSRSVAEPAQSTGRVPTHSLPA